MPWSWCTAWSCGLWQPQGRFSRRSHAAKAGYQSFGAKRCRSSSKHCPPERAANFSLLGRYLARWNRCSMLTPRVLKLSLSQLSANPWEKNHWILKVHCLEAARLSDSSRVRPSPDMQNFAWKKSGAPNIPRHVGCLHSCTPESGSAKTAFHL